MQRLTGVVKHLLVINVLFFIAKQILTLDSFALYFPETDHFRPYQIITHMFMHGNLMHILFNMFALWMFGSGVESVWGSKKFLFFYLTAGLGAALFTIGIDYYQYNQLIGSLEGLNLSNNAIEQIMASNNFSGVNNILTDSQIAMVNKNPTYHASISELYYLSLKSMLGASGAIMGVLVAFGMLFPNAELMLIFFPIPIKAKYFIPVIIGMDIFSGLTGVSIFSPSNTAYWAHVGGALTGLILVLYWKKTQFNKNRWN